ncbi:ankyrin repeat domain-containing protein [Wolbachia endosymbiont of Laodelphax striatellus]|uniref:ankyrin repeat domain-containing protein n=1 Tax=Wolbachia endosymbiont of Laodelphax striatellus TaxID=368602 RepID=UPI00117F53A9|nr:ankyrin repeat domain-containing protein [Wolbachia endosymbiont of Laodelphax striatellus]
MSINSIIHKNRLVLLIALAVCIVIVCISLSKKRDKDSITKLEIASETCDLENIELLMQNDANIAEKALHYTAEKGCLGIIKFLVEKGVDVNTANKFKRTALHYAADNGHLEIVKFLLDKGSNPTATDRDGRRPRDMAVVELRYDKNKGKPYREIIKLLAKAEDQYESTKSNH